MKQYKVRIKLKSSPSTVETVITANSSNDVRKLLEGQYGSNLQSFGIPQEIKK
jgi:hypothetical protein